MRLFNKERIEYRRWLKSLRIGSLVAVCYDGKAGLDRPIIMKDAMVRAVLSGQKTQTRSPVKGNPPGEFRGWILGTNRAAFMEGAHGREVKCPFGQIGDRLWVRETFAIVHPYRDCETGYVDDIKQPSVIPNDNAGGYWVPWYRSDWKGDDDTERGFKWTPSIHMPRWASRIALPLVSVRVERVQDISEADVWAEGYGEHWQKRVREAGADGPLGYPDARGWFAMLWDELYGTWAQNPWVWVAEWKEIEVSK